MGNIIDVVSGPIDAEKIGGIRFGDGDTNPIEVLPDNEKSPD